MNKKGLSTVVVTVIMILIAIIAIAILWYALRPVIEEGAGQAGKTEGCLYLALSVDSAEYKSVGLSKVLDVTVKREAGAANLEEIKVVVDGTIMNRSTNVPEEAEMRTYSINLSAKGVNAKPTKVEIAGQLVGNVTCAISDTVEASEIEGN